MGTRKNLEEDMRMRIISAIIAELLGEACSKIRVFAGARFFSFLISVNKIGQLFNYLKTAPPRQCS